MESLQTVVNSWNDFDTLRHVIVGRADLTCIPPSEPATEAKIPSNSDMRGMWGPRPLATIEKANEQLDSLTCLLEGRGIRVDRPTPIQWNQAVVTPDFSTQSMFGCMPPRDVLLTVGKEILSAPMSFRCRYWEYLAYHTLMQQYFDDDPEFRWEQAPRPRLTDRSYKAGYFDDITIEERLERTAMLDFVTTEDEPLFDAADVLRIGKDLFCQHGLTTNRRGMKWLQRHFPNHRIHVVNFPGDPYPIHIDATFVPLRPGLIMNNPNRRLPEDQRKIFAANDWEIVDAARPAHNSPPPLCYSSVWLSMNVLILDHKTVVVEASENYQMDQFYELGFEVLPLAFRDAYPFGGGLHCATADVLRVGDCEDYFPNQVPGTQIS
ncbi:MAG: serine/threonine protein kinase [Acidiferrobacteraceae bacterium]|nr:serine/threonine protein kinase [Acidiferrobacteraceae bacterium]|tara:strand:+ start:1188 stop:2321 length:1134 start_codon:yes stop_codon:yes gene_type:complete